MAKAKAKTAPVEELEDEDVELEELDEDAPEETKSKKGKADEVEFGASDLAAYLTKKTGKNVTARDLRTLIRKMAREENPRVNREVIPGNRSRYNWPGGLKNPEVKAIIAAVTKGELEQGKKEALEKLKEQKAAKQAAKAAAGGKGKKGKGKGKAKAEPEPEELDDDEIEIEIDDDE